MEIFTQFTPSLSSLWENAVSHEKNPAPFYTPAWHQHWFSRFGAKETLTIMADANAGVILPLAVSDGVAHFTGGEEIADYLDAIGNDTAKASCWREALPLLKDHGATSLTLRNIPDGSPTLAYFRTLPGAGIAQEDTTPILTLTDSFDAYLSALDRKDRHELRRKMKKFEAEHTDLTFSVRTTSAIQMDALLHLMKYDTDKETFLTADMTAFFTDLPATVPDTLRQFVLTAGEKIIAVTLAFQTRDALLLYNSGFDPQYPGAGWYIKVRTIAWAIEQKLTQYNFLQGSERYKYDLGGRDFPVYKITLSL